MLETLSARFPKSFAYDIEWMADNEMGPNALWLTEFLTEAMTIRKGARILDLGCGKAASSIFLAKEFGAEVWAADLWISPTENWKRIQEAGLASQVFPIYTEAHELPFAQNFFDIILSIDAYKYFGTDDMYLPYLINYLKPEGTLGIVVPGIKEEFGGEVPEHLKPVWEPELFSLHSPDWWKTHFLKTGLLNVTTSDYLENSWEIWRFWEQYLVDNQLINPNRGDDFLFLCADRCKSLCLFRIISTKKSKKAFFLNQD